MLWPLLLALAGFLAAYVPVGLGWADLPAGTGESLMVVGAAWCWWSFARRRGWWRAGAALAVTAATGFHLLWLFDFSSYGESGGVQAPAIGLEAQDIEAIRVRDKAHFRLSLEREHGVLLVFFRGAW